VLKISIAILFVLKGVLVLLVFESKSIAEERFGKGNIGFESQSLHELSLLVDGEVING
jgi:hypothetical protein